MRYYVYFHKRTDLNVIFYVGKGSGDRDTDTDGRNKHWHRIARKCGYNIIVTRHDIDFPTEAEAHESEKFWIAHYKPFGHLVNMTEGGEGFAGLQQTEEQKKKIGLSKLGNRYAVGNKGNTGRKYTEEEIRKRLEAPRHFGLSFEEKRKMKSIKNKKRYEKRND